MIPLTNAQSPDILISITEHSWQSRKSFCHPNKCDSTWWTVSLCMHFSVAKQCLQC